MYVTHSYNTFHAVRLAIPVEGGVVLLARYRTSTDGVPGFGARRFVIEDTAAAESTTAERRHSTSRAWMVGVALSFSPRRPSPTAAR